LLQALVVALALYRPTTRIDRIAHPLQLLFSPINVDLTWSICSRSI